MKQFEGGGSTSHFRLEFCPIKFFLRLRITSNMELQISGTILVILALTGACSGQQVTNPPSPATGLLGSTAQFSCNVDFEGGNEYIELVYGNTLIYYYDNGETAYPSPVDRYTVERDGDTFTLTINDLQYSDATAKYGFKPQRVNVEEAELIVLDTPTVDAITAGNVAGNVATYSCKANFGGPGRADIGDSHFPEIRMFLDGIQQTGTDTEREPDGTDIFYTLTKEVNVTLNKDMNEKYMVCEMRTVTPDVTVTGNFTMDVQFPVNTPTYTPEKGTYVVGDVITCQADGNPEVTYTWQDDTGGDPINGAELTVTDDMVGDTNVWTCTAVNTVNGETFPDTVQVTFEVDSEPPPEEGGAESWKIAVGVAVPICILIIGAIVGLVVYTFVLKKKPQKPNSNIPMNNSMDGSGRNGRFSENPGYKDSMDEEKIPPFTIHSPNRYQNSPNLPFNGDGTPPPNYKYQADLLGTGLGSNLSLPLDDTTPSMAYNKPTPTKRIGSKEMLAEPPRDTHVSFDENARDYDDEEDDDDDDDNDSMPPHPPPPLPNNADQFRPAPMPTHLPPPDTMV